MQPVSVFLVNIAHSYMIKSFLGLRNGKFWSPTFQTKVTLLALAARFCGI